MTLRISLCCDAAHQTARTLSHSAILGLQLDFAADFHDALEFPDGSVILLTSLWEGQEAVVLQLPAQAKTASESEAQKRAVYIG